MASYIIRYFRKIKGYYQKNGFLWFCRHIFANLVHYKKWVILETEIDENHFKTEAKIPVNIRLLTESQEDIAGVTELHRADDHTRPVEMIEDFIKRVLLPVINA